MLCHFQDVWASAAAVGAVNSSRTFGTGKVPCFQQPGIGPDQKLYCTRRHRCIPISSLHICPTYRRTGCRSRSYDPEHSRILRSSPTSPTSWCRLLLNHILSRTCRTSKLCTRRGCLQLFLARPRRRGALPNNHFRRHSGQGGSHFDLRPSLCSTAESHGRSWLGCCSSCCSDAIFN